MAEINLKELQPDDVFLVDLGDDIWLMDNHRWALWVWEFHRERTMIDRFTLAHADYHWDGGYHPYECSIKQAEIEAANLDQLHALLAEDVWIRYDSFIAPAVVRGRFDAVHFFCLQDDDWDVAIDKGLLERAGTSQVIHGSANSFAALQASRPVILDLCLDLFNRESKMTYKGDLWSEEDIEKFLQLIRPLAQTASLITISLSFGCSGTEADTRWLAEFVLPRLQQWRMDARSATQ